MTEVNVGMMQAYEPRNCGQPLEAHKGKVRVLPGASGRNTAPPAP